MDKIVVHEDSLVDIRFEDGQSVCGVRVGKLHKILDRVVEIVNKPQPNYRKEFKQWMKERNLWKKFKGNGGIWFSPHPPEEFISRSFRWNESPEGFKLWQMVNNAWIEHLKEDLGYE